MTNSHKTWRKSNYTSSDNCVELVVGLDEIDIRDSKDSDNGTFAVKATAWMAFLGSVKSGGFRR
ncbi:DUF397 domain-containing protein [Lentzea sp. DG1S-22]|uniref:DUF397 domain-containing protein n=1 Tax=Lentzea sp. DG1S-22 TaxID=3108822 RepID=UPI002E761DCE|nr:DUF397 domain-containing protein [Lentzea sp. DG1S-22]WVH77705.1 DUF397 domain-containing protein [Lentzea sp. DG1S-22]